ncbi:MAG: caspase family protein, partial [Bacteroidota bacterium]
NGVPAKGDKKPHIVVTLDCCHSGSGTRDFMENPNFKTRNHDFLQGMTRGDGISAKAVRTLDSYYKGYYADMPGALRIPSSKHVLLSACTNLEKAGDLSGIGGVFTSSLIEILDEAQGAGETLNYPNLYTRTRSRVLGKRSKQSPQFETIFGFNAYTAFLEGWESGNPEEAEVFPKGKSWYVRFGAIHGLPVRSEEKIQVRLYKSQGHEFLGTATIKKVNMQESKLAFEGEVPLKKREDTLDKDESVEPYVAEIVSLPAEPQYVWVNAGDNASVGKSLKEAWGKQLTDRDPNLERFNILTTDDKDSSDKPEVEIRISAEGNMELYDMLTGKRKFSAIADSGDPNKSLREIKSAVATMMRWKRLFALENPKSKLADLFELELNTMDYQEWKKGEYDFSDADDLEELYRNMTVHNAGEIKLYGSKDNLITEDNAEAMGIGWEKDGILHRFKLKSKSEEDDLFFYFYTFNDDCGIKLLKDVAMEKATSDEGFYLSDLGLLRLEDHESEAHFRFKMIISKQRIDPTTLEQAGLEGSRGDFGGIVGASDMADWDTATLEIKLIRQEAQVNDSDDVKMAEGAMVIKPHKGIKADLSLVSASANSRSLDPSNKLGFFEQQDGVEMVSFSGTRGLGSQNVLELTNLEVEDPAALEDDPLQIQLGQDLGDDEMMLPLAFDGQHFRIIGESESKDGKTQINIRSLPEVRPVMNEDGTKVENPFGEEAGDRSLFRALKMAFFKVYLKKPLENKLQFIEYKDNGDIQYRVDGLKNRVQTGENLLLLIHGIIGNTQEMAENMGQIMDADGKALATKFDTVLTYDYENLNTPIREIATQLQTALSEAGFDGSAKKLTIMAHSMGGLVSRWYVERLGGNAVVKKVILAGTPNQGSVFGKIEGARKFAIQALDIAANFLPDMIPFSGTLLKGLKAPAEALVTLGEMMPNSGFLTELNDSPDPGVEYAVVAGDVTEFDADKKGFGAFLEGIQKRIGELVQKEDRHDIAVSVESILNKVVWEGRKQAVKTNTPVCHHMNYFTADEGRKAIAEAVG